MRKLCLYDSLFWLILNSPTAGERPPNMISRKYSSTLGFSLVAILISGCGVDGPELIPVNGKVTIKGKPAGNISLQFLPDVQEDAGGVWPSSIGLSKPDGTFELHTSDNQLGAVAGRHRLIIVDIDEERPEQGKERTKPIRLDSRYAIAGTISVEVQPGKLVEIAIP